MTKEIVGFNIRLAEKMAEQGVTQAELCRLTGLASSMVSHYCTGQRMPSIPAALKIAKVLNTTVDYLAFGEIPKVVKLSGDALNGADRNLPSKVRYRSLQQIEDEQTLLYMYRSLSTGGKTQLLDYIDSLLSNGNGPDV